MSGVITTPVVTPISKRIAVCPAHPTGSVMITGPGWSEQLASGAGTVSWRSARGTGAGPRSGAAGPAFPHGAVRQASAPLPPLPGASPY